MPSGDPSVNRRAKRLLDIHTTLDQISSSPCSHDVMEVALATATSLPLCSTEHPIPVWLLIVGDPSSGKTDGVNALKDSPRVFFLDTMTDNSLASGYVDKKGNRAPCLYDKIKGKTVVIKDWTTMLSRREESVRAILGELQSAFDGKYSKATGSVGVIECEGTFSFIACVTPLAIKRHHNYMSLLGGRFLMIRLVPLTEQEREEGFERCWDEASRDEHRSTLKRLVVQHLEDLHRSPPDLQPEADTQKQDLNRLARFIARGRGAVITERVTDLDEATGQERCRYEVVDIQVEEPFRVLQQLRTLGRALARLHGRGRMTDHEIELLRRVALSTVPPERAQILGLYGKGHGELSVSDCASALGCSRTRARQVLTTLAALGVLAERKHGPQSTYSPAPDMAPIVCRPVTGLDHTLDLSTQVTQNSTHIYTTTPPSPVRSLVSGQTGEEPLP